MLQLLAIIFLLRKNTCHYPKRAKQVTQDRKISGSIPAWIQCDFASKYKAYLFRIFVADDHDVWDDRMHIPYDEGL